MSQRAEGPEERIPQACHFERVLCVVVFQQIMVGQVHRGGREEHRQR